MERHPVKPSDATALQPSYTLGLFSNISTLQMIVSNQSTITALLGLIECSRSCSDTCWHAAWCGSECSLSCQSWQWDCSPRRLWRATLLILGCWNMSTVLSDCILHLEGFVTFMKYLWCYSVYSIVLLLGKQERCYHPFAVGALLQMWGLQDMEKVEVSREKSHVLYSQLVDMKNEICLGTQIYSVVAITSILTSIPNVFNNELSSLAEKRKNEIIR